MMSSSSPPFIGISGLIGAGKTTLSTSLGKVMGLPVFHERLDRRKKGYLADFYKDTKKYAFSFQIHLLNQRFRQHQEIVWCGKGGIQDRTIYEDGIFAKMLLKAKLMSERDYITYKDLFAHMSQFMRKPSLIIHLDVTPEESLARIKKRGRECESSITLEYLTALHEGYEEFLDEISKDITIIRVDWSLFRSSEDLAIVIKKAWGEIKNMRYVKFKTEDKKKFVVLSHDKKIKLEYDGLSGKLSKF